MKIKKRNIRFILILALAAVCELMLAQTVSEIEKQKREADKEIKETKAELGANEKKVNQSLATLRKIEGDIAVSQKEIETVKGQLQTINNNISSLEENISGVEKDLKALREEYLKAVKKMRVAKKRNSELAFIFASGSLSEARRRMRYMKEFSDWKERRSDEIKGKVASLQDKRKQLVQAKNDAAVALKREETAKEKLNRQKEEQQTTVSQLRANSEALKSKLAKRQAEARKLSNQISALIAEQRAKEAREAEARKKEEEKRLMAEKAAAEKAAAEKAAAEKIAAEEKKKKEELAKKDTKKETVKTEKATADNKKPTAEPKKPAEAKKTVETGSEEYAEARKKKARTDAQKKETPSTVVASASGFEGMKGKLPNPVSGSFKIVSAFGVHPISPELPDIMDENLGIDAHVANGATANAVYEGEVLKVYDRTNTPGFRNIVVLRHGDYLTVYANLETLAVKSGQKVKQGQSLGTVGSDFDDSSYGLIHFELWKNQTHLDPAAWIVCGR